MLKIKQIGRIALFTFNQLKNCSGKTNQTLLISNNNHRIAIGDRNLKDDYMLFMIIERFKDNDMLPIYQRIRNEGRMLPEGLKYIDSWIEPNFSRCFQLMECDDLGLLQEWILKWRGSGATFEIIPVLRSKKTREVVEPFLD